MKRMISLLLCFVLVGSLIPGVFAVEGDPYLALGDSITSGSALNEGEPAFPQILADNNGWALTNLGSSGLTAKDLLEQISGGSCDEAIAAAKIITITAGGNDVMDVLYELVAQGYNASFEPHITAEDVIPIMLDSGDPRWWDLMLVGITILSGDASTGTPPFAEREEFLARVEECTADLQTLVAYIRNLNPDAVVIVTTQYNPYKDFRNMYRIIATSVDAGCRKLNAAIEANAGSCGYLVADVFTVFQESSEVLCNASTSPMNLDFHPNARGHEVIAQVIQGVVDQIPPAPEPVVNPFEDVKQEDFFFESVLWAVQNGITTGATETTFNPTGECQRAQVVTFLWRAAACPEPTGAGNPFEDVKEEDFYYKAVLWAAENGITNGVDDTHFAPFAFCNRAQVVTFLHRAKGMPEPTVAECPFTDVVAGEWYEAPILWAVENGITEGMDAFTFGVDEISNRAQVVTFLYRAK